MAEMWYYTNEGKQMDAVSMKELKRLVGDGLLKPTDMVWKEGMARWIRASSVKELFPDPSSALDHYFTQTGKAQPVAAAPTMSGAVTPGLTPTTTPSKPSSDSRSDPEPQKRPRPASNDDDDRPSRQRAAGGGGSMVGVMIALFLGGGVLLMALLVGVVILIIWNQGPGPQPPQPPLNQPDARPNARAPIDKSNLIDAKKSDTFRVKLNSNERRFKDYSFRKGGVYEIRVKTDEQNLGADMDLYIFGIDDAIPLTKDADPDRDCKLDFTAPEDGVYRIQVHNCPNQGIPPMTLNATVTVREKFPPPAQKLPETKKDPALPDDAVAGNGIKGLEGIAAGQFKEFKLRVKANHPARATIMGGFPTRYQLTILKENDDTEIARSQPNSTSVTFTSKETEIVRVRVLNKSKASLSCNLTFDGGK